MPYSVLCVRKACAKRQKLRGCADDVGGWYLNEVSRACVRGSAVLTGVAAVCCNSR